jgi:hypothetical protein
VRRRPPKLDPAHEPPARLRAFDAADWLPLVDLTEYREDDWRDIRDRRPVGPVKFPFEAWRRDQAWHLFSRARLAWQEEHGWPGGLDCIQLLQETVGMRLATFHGRNPEAGGFGRPL